MLIPQVSPVFGDEEKRLVLESFDAGWITEGPKTEEFGKRLNELMGTSHGVFAPNGTLALYLGLIALGVGPGDEVIVPDITFAGSANAVIMAGATPVFVDVDKMTYQIDTRLCESLVSRNTRAIMPVHLYGMAADMDSVMSFAQRHGIFVIEDAAQAVGVRYRGVHAGTIGDVGCFSFFADKTITTGEGGYVVCRSAEVYEKLLLLRNQGRINRGSFIHPAIGFNFRITDLQAAVGLAQLQRLPSIMESKLKILETYRSRLDNVPGVRFLEVQEGSSYVPFRVVLICEMAHDLMESLSAAGIQTRSFFYPMHRQPCFREFPAMLAHAEHHSDELFPNSIHGYEHGVCLPIYPTLEEHHINFICARIREFYCNA